jgi:hypothetical protein
MPKYADDIAKYSKKVNEEAIKGIEKHLSIALRNPDAVLVSSSDPKELARLRNGFVKKKLARAESDEALDKAIAKVMEKLKGRRNKYRVTVCYLLAEHFGQLGDFVKVPAKKA